MNPNYFTINWFQIENLLLNRIYFIFLDLESGVQDSELPPALREFRKAIAAERVAHEVPGMLENLDQPVILMCADGERSSKEAEALGQFGLTNVFVVEGGAQELLKDYHIAQQN